MSKLLLHTTVQSPEPRCPTCGRTLKRVPRNPLDRLISLGVRLRRYRCRAMGCGWHGTLRVD
jgi:hypothetical protein